MDRLMNGAPPPSIQDLGYISKGALLSFRVLPRSIFRPRPMPDVGSKGALALDAQRIDACALACIFRHTQA